MFNSKVWFVGAALLGLAACGPLSPIEMGDRDNQIHTFTQEYEDETYVYEVEAHEDVPLYQIENKLERFGWQNYPFTEAVKNPALRCFSVAFYKDKINSGACDSDLLGSDSFAKSNGSPEAIAQAQQFVELHKRRLDDMRAAAEPAA